MTGTAPRLPASEPLAALREQLARQPGGILEQVAEQHGLPLRTVVECLPAAMRGELAGDRFCEILEAVSGWGPVRLIVHTTDGVFEFSGPLPRGQLGRGFYNLQGEGALSGHLRADRCRSIVVVRRPFMGKQTASLQFFNEAGSAMFKIFLGRDAAGELRADQLARLDALEQRLAAAAR